MNITPEIPRLDPVRVQVRRHALMNEINRKPARRGWRLAVPATGLAAAVTIGAVWWTTPAPPQVADDPALAGQCDLALARAEPDRPFTAPKSAVVERREQIALVVMIHFETRWFCVFDGRSQIVARKSDVIEGRPPRVASGPVRPDARSVRVDTADGKHLTSQIGEGLAVKWSPSDAQVTLITFYDEDGHVLETVAPRTR